MKALLEIVKFDVNDIVTTSGSTGGENEGTGTCNPIPGLTATT